MKTITPCIGRYRKIMPNWNINGETFQASLWDDNALRMPICQPKRHLDTPHVAYIGSLFGQYQNIDDFACAIKQHTDYILKPENKEELTKEKEELSNRQPRMTPDEFEDWYIIFPFFLRKVSGKAHEL